MPKKKRKEKSASKEREALIASLGEQFGISEARARAIVVRYGPSRQPCAAAVATFLEIERLVSSTDDTF